MLEFAAGIGAALTAVALVTWRLLKLSRERNRLFYEMQKAIFRVQDNAVILALDQTDEATDEDRAAGMEHWRNLRDQRNRAAAAYYAALKGETNG